MQAMPQRAEWGGEDAGGETMKREHNKPLTKAAHNVVRAQEFLQKAYEAILPNIEAYRLHTPFEISGLNQVDYDFYGTMSFLSSVEEGLKKEGLWREQ
jgi:hypothetical protein